MSHAFYNLLHILGLILIIQSVASAVYFRLYGAGSATGGSPVVNPARKMLSILHGVGMLLILVSGFGMLARLGMTDGLPNWIYGKLVIWLVFGASIALVNKGKGSPMLWWILIIVLGGAAAWMGINKPF
ncbi:MAG: hypothetical protein RIE53_10980 [Rhodothermales bacterium]